MRLHANAPLGPKGRATMVRRVVAADWSLTQAAEAAPQTLANRTDESRIETIAALRRLRMTGAEIAECLEMALSTSLRGPGPNRLGQAQPARAARACEPL